MRKQCKKRDKGRNREIGQKERSGQRLRHEENRNGEGGDSQGEG